MCHRFSPFNDWPPADYVYYFLEGASSSGSGGNCDAFIVFSTSFRYSYACGKFKHTGLFLLSPKDAHDVYMVKALKMQPVFFILK
jgi:hypothetical protein